MPTRTVSAAPELRTHAAPSFAIRVPVRLAGFIILALVAVLLLSLASWSVDDPSLSYATSKRPDNWLGVPGAIIADLAFQLFGVGVLAFALPPAIWSWNLLRRHVPTAMLLRGLAWLGAGILTAGVLSFWDKPASWPLPTGLGGVVGNLFSNLAANLAGAEPQPVTATLFAILLGLPALALFWIALGLKTLPVLSGGAARRARADDLDAEREGNPLMDIAIGALVHLGFSARTALRRAVARQKAQREQDADSWREDGAEPHIEPRLSEPGLSDAEPAVRPARRPINIATRSEPAEAEPEDEEPPFDLDEEDDGLADFAPETPVSPVPASGGLGAKKPMSRATPTARSAADAASAPSRGPMAVQPPSRVSAPAAPPAQALRQVQPAPHMAGSEDGETFELPSLSLLAEPKRNANTAEHNPERLEAMARRLEGVLQDFGVRGDIINVRPGPVVTLYELEPAPGIKSSRVISLADDIARSMSAISARVAVVPGRNAIGIELPNENRETVYLREMLASGDFDKMKGKLPICLGKTIGGEPIIVDLARMPHLLIAGTTGSGKSVGINTMILSLLYRMTPEQCRLIMIDPKMLELSIYDGIPHLLTPVVTDPSKAVVALKWAVREMEDRYRKMSKIGVRNIDGFNQRVSEAAARGEVITRTVQTGFDKETGEAIFESEEFHLEPLPYIVVIVDEMADLMMVAGKDIEGAIQRLAQMARAAGIHIIMATQRPSVDVITGTIKANFPTRISFQVTSKIDSRTILGEQGAEQLLGNGDMLYMAGGGRIKRLHGPFCSDGEVESVVTHLKSQGAPDYLDSITADEDEDGPITAEMAGEDGGSGDDLYDKAVAIVLQDKKASTSYVQRRLAIGYNRAATLIERMEQEGVISGPNHAGKREILVGNNAEGY